MKNNDPFRPIIPKSIEQLRDEYKRDRVWRALLKPIDWAKDLATWKPPKGKVFMIEDHPVTTGAIQEHRRYPRKW